MSKSTQVAADVAALLRARNPLLWIVTREEARVEGFLMEIAAKVKLIPRTWDCAQGVADMAGRQQTDIGSQDIGITLSDIKGRASETSGTDEERGMWIMRDLPVWLNGPIGITTLRALRNLVRELPTAPQARAQSLIILSPDGNVPPELADHATVIEWPLPDREEIGIVLDGVISALSEERRETAAPNGTRDAAIDAAVGLSAQEAEACYSKSLVQLRKIDPLLVGKEKKRVVAREKVLEWYDPIPGGLDALGGLAELKAWLVSRRMAYTVRAREYGLPAPKGAFLVGVPGCGKSLCAKAIATAWGVPLLKLDLGSLKGKFVGESEGNLRKALAVIETVGRCVVWLDEIEKAMSGATQGAADGGVSADQLGTILTWMQERVGEAFVIATSNDAEQLPPELLRAGRFDDVWWVDLPTSSEKVDILLAALKAHGRDATVFENTEAIRRVTDACDGYTGAEIAQMVPNALYAAFADGEREIEPRDLLEAARKVVPLSRTAAEKIDRLRKWAVGRARPASGGDIPTESLVRRERTRTLDLEE